MTNEITPTNPSFVRHTAQGSSIILVMCWCQYPGEVEYLWVPCSFLQQSGPRYVEVTDEGAVVLVPARIALHSSYP